MSGTILQCEPPEGDVVKLDRGLFLKPGIAARSATSTHITDPIIRKLDAVYQPCGETQLRHSTRPISRELTTRSHSMSTTEGKRATVYRLRPDLQLDKGGVTLPQKIDEANRLVQRVLPLYNDRPGSTPDLPTESTIPRKRSRLRPKFKF